jgi:hypothetical protein
MPAISGTPFFTPRAEATGGSVTPAHSDKQTGPGMRSGGDPAIPARIGLR